MPQTLDHPRLCKVLNMLDARTDQATRMNALDIATKMLGDADVTWADLAAAHQKQSLFSQMNRLRGEFRPGFPG